MIENTSQSRRDAPATEKYSRRLRRWTQICADQILLTTDSTDAHRLEGAGRRHSLISLRLGVSASLRFFPLRERQRQIHAAVLEYKSFLAGLLARADELFGMSTGRTDNSIGISVDALVRLVMTVTGIFATVVHVAAVSWAQGMESMGPPRLVRTWADTWYDYGPILFVASIILVLLRRWRIGLWLILPLSLIVLVIGIYYFVLNPFIGACYTSYSIIYLGGLVLLFAWPPRQSGSEIRGFPVIPADDNKSGQ